MICRAPPIRAPWMIDSPTPPQPNTREAGDDVIAGRDRSYLGADCLDDTSALMAENDGPVEREAPDAVDDVEIAVAHPGGGGTDQHLAAPRLVDVDRLDRQRLVH